MSTEKARAGDLGEGDMKALDALQNAGRLYERYLRIAEIGSLAGEADVCEDQAVSVGAWDQPVGLVIGRSK